jgi:hypothetical protein
MRLRERLANALFGDVVAARISEAERRINASADERVREAFSAGVQRDDDAKMIAQGFRQLTTGRLRSIRELPPLAQDHMLRIVNWLRESNPLAEWLLNTTVDFTLGEGFKVTSEHPEVQDICSAFVEDPVNQLDHRFDRWALEFGMYGELCLPAFTNEVDGHVRLGYVDPFAIDYVLTDPDNVLIRTAVVLKAPEGAPKKPILKVIREDTLRRSPTYELLMPALWMERDPQLNVPYDGSCFLFQTNHVSNATRGRSDLLPLIDWLDGYDQFLFDSLDTANLFNSFVYDLKVEGATEEQIKAKLAILRSLKKGQIYGHNEKESLTAVTPDLKAQDKNIYLRDVRGHIIGSKGYPEHWFGLGGDVNFASAKEMGLPPVKRLTKRQKELRLILGTLLRYQLHAKVRVGALPREVVLGRVSGDGSSRGKSVAVGKAFKIEMPELSMRDTSAIVAAATSLAAALTQAVSQGWVRPPTAARIFAAQLSQLGIEIDPELEWDSAAGAASRDYNAPDLQQLLARLNAQLQRQGNGNGDNITEPKRTTPVGGAVST